MTVTINEFSFTSPIDASALAALGDTVENVGETVITALETTKEVLELAKKALIADLNPQQAILQALAVAIDDLIGGLQDAGVTLTAIPPELSSNIAIQTNLQRLADSVVDKFDLQRPITSGSSVDATVVIITASSDFNDIARLWNTLMDLLFNWKKFDLEAKFKKVGTLPQNNALGYTQAPDWAGVKLGEAVPLIGDVLEALRTISRTLVDTIELAGELIDFLIQLIDEKIRRINSLIEQLDSLVDRLVSAGSFTSDELNTVLVEGTFNEVQLRTEINSAAEFFPSPQGNEASFLIAMSTIEPVVGDILKAMFVGDQLEAA